MDGIKCTKWSYNITVFDRNNSYVFYATKTKSPKPVYFEMNGYDTLLVSYYDKYVIRYHSFEEWDYDPDNDPDVFEVPHRKYSDIFCQVGAVFKVVMVISLKYKLNDRQLKFCLLTNAMRYTGFELTQTASKTQYQNSTIHIN